jgi:hypothetical protein
MNQIKILNNPNKIISKLPFILPKSKPFNLKYCNSLIGNQIKLKLIEPIYLNVTPEDIIQTFLYLYNNNEGKGIFVDITKNKIKSFLIFNNDAKGIISKSELKIIKNIYNMLKSILKKVKIQYNVFFFINLSKFPVIHQKLYTEDKKKFVHVVSFSSSHSHYDIALPIPNINSWKQSDNGILFLFEKDKIKLQNKNSFSIYNRITELKSHPYYKTFNLNYIIIEDNYDVTKINLLKNIVIISDNEVPIYYQQLLNSGCELILIENYNYYDYYSKLLIPNIEYISWSFSNWENSLDKFVHDKKISNNLKKWVEINYNLESIQNKYIGFLDHLNMNYYQSKITVEPFNDLSEQNYNITTQLDYDKFFNLLQKNYSLIRCWSYRLNPYSSLLAKLKTNHNFVPEFIKLCISSLPPFENLHWISNRRILLDYIPIILKSAKSNEFKEKITIKNTFNYVINNSDELLSMNIINNNSSVFYIEIGERSSKFNLWENDFVSDLETILQFINNQPAGSHFIIRTYTFQLPRTLNLIKTIQTKFEKFKLLKNEWFDSYLPFRYFVGINYLKDKKSDEKIILDLETYNNMFFSLETQELIKIIKYIKSDAQVNPELFLNYNLVNNWFDKWLNKSYL